nr:formin-like protein 5 [Aegilops tauschii subsp. strangulata]
MIDTTATAAAPTPAFPEVAVDTVRALTTATLPWETLDTRDLVPSIHFVPPPPTHQIPIGIPSRSSQPPPSCFQPPPNSFDPTTGHLGHLLPRLLPERSSPRRSTGPPLPPRHGWLQSKPRPRPASRAPELHLACPPPRPRGRSSRTGTERPRAQSPCCLSSRRRPPSPRPRRPSTAWSRDSRRTSSYLRLLPPPVVFLEQELTPELHRHPVPLAGATPAGPCGLLCPPLEPAASCSITSKEPPPPRTCRERRHDLGSSQVARRLRRLCLAGVPPPRLCRPLLPLLRARRDDAPLLLALTAPPAPGPASSSPRWPLRQPERPGLQRAPPTGQGPCFGFFPEL